MTAKTETHWRDFFPTDYLHADELNGKEFEMEISHTGQENLILPGGANSPSLVISFKGAKKKLILNKTNTEMIAKNLNTPIIEKWVGKKITIYPTTCKFKGDVTPCIRIKSKRGSMA